MSYCKRIKGILLSLDFRMGFITLVRISCKQWGCPCCAKKNARNWRAYLLDTFNKRFRGVKWCFITITANKNAHKHSSEMTILNLQQVWKVLYDRLLRRYGRDQMEYVRVFEQHKSGRFHMHILLSCGEGYDAHGIQPPDLKSEKRHPECRWLKDTVKHLGGGEIAHIRRVMDYETRSQGVGLVVGYILKYMGKDMCSFKFPPHKRRIQTSRRVGSPKTAAVGIGTWEHKREIGTTYLREAKQKIVDMTTGEILNERSFEGESYYPPLEYYTGLLTWEEIERTLT